jgi:LysR family transcriptional regulator, transcriptional activator of the cysJI operon
MEINTLKIFCDLVEIRNFTRVGHKHGIVQSAVSHQIGALEKQSGRKLFDRTGAKGESVVPTPDGLTLYRHSLALLYPYERIEQFLNGEKISD